MIIAIIQARVGSTRLPGKVLFNLEGKTVLEHIIERVKSSALTNEVLVATSTNKEDLEIARLCANLKIRVFCGSSTDVLDRYYQAARLLKPNHMVRIMADCPLIDPKIIDKVIALHINEKADYTANTLKETFPDGEDVEIFTFDCLKKTWKEAKLISEREHVTSFMRKSPNLFKLVNLEGDLNFFQKRWTLDEKDDYRFIKLIYKGLYKNNHLFGMDQILSFLKLHPEFEKINQTIRRNQGYAKSLTEDRIAIQD